MKINELLHRVKILPSVYTTGAEVQRLPPVDTVNFVTFFTGPRTDSAFEYVDEH